MGVVNSLGVVFYQSELKSIAKRAKVPEGTLLLLQLVYEASAACTSIVFTDDQVFI
jgi:hypothetical protein